MESDMSRCELPVIGAVLIRISFLTFFNVDTLEKAQDGARWNISFGYYVITSSAEGLLTTSFQQQKKHTLFLNCD
jgi:hypothetical protein